MTFYQDKDVLVTGSTGMIGSHLVEALIDKGANVRVISHLRNIKILPKSKKLKILKADLTKFEDCKKAVKDMDYVFQLAAVVGGVGFNVSHRGTLFTKNILIQTNILEASRQEGIKKYLFTSSACVYPGVCKIPISEEECVVGVFDRPPERTNDAYGWAKRMGELQAQYYKEEYGMKIAIVRPFNVYGPRDNFNLETTHVIPALIRKAVERQKPYKIWGTGEPSRDFVFVTDTVNGMMLALEKYVIADPINLASGIDIKIKDLASIILKISGYENPQIVFEKSKPLGQLVRRGSIEKVKKVLGFETKVSLKEGLRRTIDWYRKKFNVN
jgi:GDP-L-fucose synthase